MKFNQLSIRNRVLLAIAFVFVASTAITAYFSYQRQLTQLQESLKDMAQSESKLFDSIIGADAEGLARAHIGLDRTEGLLALLAAGKKDELASMVKPIFSDMKQRNNITHFYFIKPDGTVLLRAHKPEQFGDKLTRTTYLKAKETQALASGIEMGKNFFSLRSVAPVSYKGEPVGYFEVGQEIDHVVEQMKRTTGNEVSIFLHSDFLKAKNAEVNGGKVGEFTILDSTNSDLALKVAGLALPELRKGAAKPCVTLVDLRGAKYVVAVAPMRDAAGASTGVLFSLKDVTPLFAAMWRGTAANTVLFAAIFLGAIVLLFLSLRQSLKLFGDLKEHVVAVTTSWDLTGQIAVSTNDEVGQLAHAFNSMVGSLNNMVARIHESSGRLATTAQQISSSTGLLSDSSREQDGAASKASSTIVHMSTSIETVASNADSLASNAGQVAQVIQQLSASSEQVAVSAQTMSASVGETSANIEQMTASIENVAKNAEELMSSVSETSSTIEEMTVSIDQVAVNAQELQQVVKDSANTIGKMAASIKEVAKKVEAVDNVAKGAAKEGSAGLEAGQQAVAAMSRVAEVIDKTSASIVTLGKRSEEIGNIVKVINEIANQTNLLALNAAIEAARAGEAGRGFAVVADEVRKLAERSMGATREIAQVIRQVQEDTGESVRYGEIASQEAKSSVELTNLVGGALENIVSSIEQTSTLMTEIASMTLEHAGASNEVIRAVEKMDEASEVVVNAAREQAAGGRQIRVAVERMNHITREVTGATQQQAQGSQMIRIAVRDMNQVTAQVSVATQEQSDSARQIVSAVTAMTSMTQSVANATADQKKGGEMVALDVQNISTITRDNLASVEELAGAAQHLSRQAEEMAALVALFKVA